nr:hypothetical protein [Tanacetum cinerariifolium]
MYHLPPLDRFLLLGKRRTPYNLLPVVLETTTRPVIGDKESVISKKDDFEVVEGLKVLEEHPRCCQAKGLKVEEKLVHLMMVFKVLIEKKKIRSLGLIMFDWWMEFWMVHLEELEMKKLL